MNDEKQLTGYPSIDKPWEMFYKNIEESNRFTNTTPYIGLKESNEEYPNEIAIEYFGAKISFGELLKKIDGVAKSLEAYGIRSGDFVTICSTTTPEVIYIFYAVSKIGAIVNVISPFYEPGEFIDRIDECKSKLIFIVDKFYPKYREILCSETYRQVVIVPLMNSALLRFVNKQYKINDYINENTWKLFVRKGIKRSNSKTMEYIPKYPVAMVYSSGTTGSSKGILLSIDSFQRLINAYGSSGFDTSRGQKVYQNIPPWHSTGLSLGINFPLSYGVKVCIDPRFDQDIFVKNVLRFRLEYILTNTTMFQSFTFEKSLKMLKGKSLSFLKYPVEGGEPLTEKDVLNIEKVFRNHGSNARLLNGYGECECGATVTTDITSHKFSNNASGIPLPKITTIGIFDNEFHELKYKERGNILVKTEIGMLEYFNKPEATKEYFYLDSKGERWSKTGDIGYINEDGSLVVLGRASDVSVINGKTFYNFDVERAVLVSDKVKLCEVQMHPTEENIVIHIVWENDVKMDIANHPNRLIKYLLEVKEITMQKIQDVELQYFCVWDSFPSAHSGKRDVESIRQNIEGLIRVKNKATQAGR